ncbi:MAG: CHAT domain-containing protein [Bacteroidota bacterium]
MKYHLLLILTLFSCLEKSVCAQAPKSQPYSVQELREAYYFHPFDDIDVTPLDRERLEAGIQGRYEVALWSYLSLAKSFRGNRSQYLVAAYDLGSALEVDNTFLSYICYEVARSYAEKYMFTFASVYAGKGLELVSRGSYEWLLNWTYFAVHLSEDAFMAPLIDRFSNNTSNEPVEEALTLLYLNRARIVQSTFCREVMIDLREEAYNAKPYFKFIFWSLCLYWEYRLADVVSLPDFSIFEELHSSIEHLFDKLSPEDQYEYKYALRSYHRLKSEYIEANQKMREGLTIAETYLETLENPQFYDSLTFNFRREYYANSLLFLTREGKGIEPVIEAFNIYRETYLDKLALISENINLFDFIRQNHRIIGHDNILLIGGYLYQQTGDISYLSNSINHTDIARSATVYLHASKYRNSNRSFQSQNIETQWINEIRALSQEDSNFDELILLSRAYEEFLNKEPSNSFASLDLDADVSLFDVQQEMNDSTGMIYLSYNKLFVKSIIVLQDTILYHTKEETLDNLTESIENLINLSARTDLTESELRELTDLSRNIYENLVGDFADILPPNLEIITGGLLDGIPFSILRTDSTGNTPAYFGDKHKINYSYSLRTRHSLRNRENKPVRQQMLAMAPSFNSPVLLSSRSGDGTRQAGALANNRDEVEFLESQFPGVFVYDASATLSEFTRQAENYSVIHLATHAEANAANGNRSRIYFTDEEIDNMLYAFQLPNFELNADLVTLSACETGTGGRRDRKGLIGLSQAFLAAGAKSVLSTRWAVDDRATAEIMADFYAQIQAGKPKDEALFYAQRAYRQRHEGTQKASPYYWAAFNLIGDPSPISFKKDWHYDWWKWAIAGFLVLLALGSLRRKMTS